MKSLIVQLKTAFLRKAFLAFIALYVIASTVPLDLNGQSNTCIPGSVNSSNGSPWSPDCYLKNDCSIQGNPCQANDVDVTGAFVADILGNPIQSCTPGQTVNAYLWGNFTANATRYAVRAYSEILVDGVQVSVFNDCAFETIPVGTSAHLLVPITFTCGQAINLLNVWVAWDTQNGATCAGSTTCGDYPSSKCFQNLDATGLSVLVPNFDFACGSVASEICFSDATSGGTPSYTYLWEFGDPGNSTSTLANPCFTYPATGMYTATLTVTDDDGVVAMVSREFDISALNCCAVTCPNNLDLGSFTCLTIGNLPALPTTEADLADYSITTSGCSNITVSASDSPSPNICAASDQTITRTIEVSEGGSVIGTCEFTYVIEVDDEDPTITCPTDPIDLGCNPETLPTNADAEAAISASNDNCGVASIVATAGNISGTCTKTQIFNVVITDDCGRTANCDVTYTWSDDTEDPTITCPTDPIDLGCNPETLPTNADAEAAISASNDNCGVASIVATAGNISGTCTKTQIFNVVITDDCGRTANCDVTYTWSDDTEDPTITCPTDPIDLGCNPETLPTNADAEAAISASNDNCGVASIVATAGNISGTCTKTQIFNVVITDDCGRTANCDVTYTWSDDTEDPTITCPTDPIDLGCNPETLPTNADAEAAISASNDNCGVASIVATAGNISGTCTKTQIFNVVITDDCGRTANCDVTYTWSDDTEDPTITCPTDPIDLGCNPETLPTNADAEAAISASNDNCGVASIVATAGNISGTCTKTQIFNVVITDDCGRTANCDVTYTWSDDTEDPTITCPTDPIDLGCNPETLPTNADAEAAISASNDNCGVASIVATAGNISGTCTKTQIFNVVITDDCGRTANCDVTYTWSDDTEDPTITCPTDPIDLGCNPETLPTNADAEAAISASNDNCGVASIVATAGNISGTCTKTQIFNVVITDDCGRTANCDVTYTWSDDTEDPTITCPTDPIDLGCNPETLPTNADAEAAISASNDNCGVASIVATAGNISGTCTKTQIFNVVITDDCGRTANCDVTYTWSDDTEDPTITCPTDPIDLGCNPETLPTNADAEAAISASNDNCGVASIVATAGNISGTCTKTQIFNVVITDDCGRTANCDVTYTWSDDTEDPTITCPTDPIDLGCNPETLPTNADAEAAISASNDNCGVASIVATAGNISGTCTKTQIFNVVITDDCGRTANCDVTYTWSDDTEDPTITCPTDPIDLGCNPETLPTNADAEAAISASNDNCGVASIVATAGNISGTCTKTQIFNVVITDDCGRTANCDVTYTWSDDTEDPTITCPTDPIDLGCNPETLPTNADAEAAISASNDNCGVASIVATAGNISGTCTKTQSFNVVITDDCGRTANCDVTYTWSDDTEDPTITCPIDPIDLGCNPETLPTNADAEAAISASNDNCGVASIVATAGNISGTCTKTQIFNVVITDDCGRTANCDVTYTWSDDTEDPTITCPTDPIDLGCNPETLPTNADAEAAISASNDNCGVASIVATAGNISGTCTKTQIFNVVITDDCGRTANCDVTYTWSDDTEDPTITCPTDPIDLGCNPETLPTNADAEAAISASNDNCGVASIVATAGNISGTCTKTQIFNVVITDDCGRTANCDVTYTWSDDTEDPTITCPTDPIDLGCNPETLPTNADAEAAISASNDNCGVASIVATAGNISGTCTKTQIFNVVITDDCGRTANCDVTYTWSDDTEDPTITCPTDPIDLGCNPETLPTNADAEAAISASNDNCGVASIVATAGNISGTCTKTQIFNVVITDDCGRTANCDVTYTWSDDTVDPTITCPTDPIDLGCNPETLPTNADAEAAISASNDNCGVASIVATAGNISGTCTKTQIFNVVITDDCGRTANCDVTYTWSDDTEDPTITCPTDPIDLGCNPETLPTNADAEAAISASNDNCGVASIVATAGNISGTCTKTQIFNVVITDDCGRTANCDVTYTWSDDTEDPTITCPTDPIDLGCNPETLPTNADAEAAISASNDNCGVASIVATAGNISGTCTKTQIFNVVITDDCGRTANCDVTYTWSDDTEDPTITCPTDPIDLGCNPETLPTNADAEAAISASNDNCGVASIVATAGNISGTCTKTQIFNVVITDDCGRTANCDVTYTWSDDTEDPTITCPTDPIDLGCNPETLPTNADAEAAISASNDNCGVASIVATAGNISGTCTKTQIFNVVITDDCGRTANCDVTYTWSDDTEDPTITCPTDPIDLGCNPETLPTNADAEAAISASNDNCGVASIVATAGNISGTCTKTQIFNVVITDDCGRTANCDVTYTWSDDTVDPTITCPTDPIDLGCNPETLPTNADAEAAISASNDNCGVASIVATAGNISGTCTKTQIFNVVITDDCGRTANCDVTYTWSDDTEDPTITCPTDPIDLGCNPETLPTNADAEAAISASNDNCGVASIVATAGNISGTCTKTQIFNVVITDDCGRTANCDVTYTWSDDTEDPTITCPTDPIDLGCNPETLPTNADAEAAISASNDNCGVASIVATAGNISGTCTKTQIFNVVITDDCGRTANCDVTYTWSDDTEDPTITCPTDPIDLGCNPETLPTNADAEAAISASNDNCGVASIVATAGNISGTCTKTQIFNVVITDDCGRTANCDVTYTWTIDVTVPVISTTAISEDLGCNPEVTPPVFTVTDNCDEEPEERNGFQLDIPLLDKVTVGGGKGDKIQINDKPSSLLMPGDLEVVVTTTGRIADEEGCGFSQEWIANYTDACGNEAESDTIRYTWTEDDEIPVIMPPADESYLGCAPVDVPTPVFTVSDNCLLADITILGTPGDTIRDGCTLSRTWTADYTDGCNMIAESKTFTYTWKDPAEDLAIEFAEGMLSDFSSGDTMTIQCYGQNPDWSLPEASLADVVITGGCGEVIPTVSEIEIEEGTCADDGFLKRFRCTWSATDECDNIVEIFIIMEIVDTIPPEITGVPADITVSCDAIPEKTEVTATDECLCADVIFTQSEITEECQNQVIITRTWTATDCCGNANTEIQQITLTDTQAPELSVLLPNGITIKDDMVLDFSCVGAGIPAAYDNLTAESGIAIEGCSGTPAVTFSNKLVVFNNCFNNALEEKVLTWTAADACGNQKSIVLTLRLIDTTPPEIIGLQDRLCADDIPFIYSSDQCTNSFLEFYDSEIDGSCGNEFKRSYVARDQCGNTSYAEVIIVREDTIAPEIELINPIFTGIMNGDTIDLEWDSQLESTYTTFNASDASFVDECNANLSVSFTETVVKEQDCETDKSRAIIRLHWSASDVCGNEASLIVYGRIVDTQAPTIQGFKKEISVSCTREIPSVIISDNSGTVTSTIDAVIIPGDCPGSYDITRTIFAIDECGNTLLETQIVHVVDQIGPHISGVDKFICEDLSIPQVTAQDDCSSEPIPVTMVQDTITNEACTGEMLIRRTWTATDLCGNTTLKEQVITFNDNTAPELVYVEEIKPFVGQSTQIKMSDAYRMSLIDDFDAYSVVAVDECPGHILDPVFNYSSVISDDCIEDGYYEKRIYTWVFTDACGNVAQQDMEIIIVDDVAPLLTSIPLDQDFGCAGMPIEGPLVLPGFMEILDSLTGNITFTEVEEVHGHETTITNTYTATDMCGNVTVLAQTLTALTGTDMACEILYADDIKCNSHENTFTANVADGNGPYTYEWDIEGKECYIQSGQGTESIKVYVGFSDVKVTLTVTDASGCETFCEVTVECISKGEVFARSTDADQESSIQIITLMPNPATDNVSFTVDSKSSQRINYSLVNMMNQKIMSQSAHLQTGINKIQLDINDYDSGIYYILIENSASSDIKRFIKVK